MPSVWIAAFELVVALTLFRWRHDSRAPELIVWVAAVFSGYRAAIWLLNITTPCPCMGLLSVTLGEKVAKGLLGWMITGSVFFLTTNAVFRERGALAKRLASSARHIFLWLTLLAYALNRAFAADDPFVGTIHGEVVIETMNIVPHHVLTVPFMVTLQDNDWSISADYGRYREVSGCDSEKICAYTVFTDEAKTQDLGEALASKVPPPAVIQSGAYPFFLEPTSRFVWLAFGSRRFFGSGEPVIPALWNMGQFNPHSHAIKIANVRYTDALHFIPESIDFVASREALKKPSIFLSGRISQKELKRAMTETADQKVLALYRVDRSTNINNWILPLSFSLTVFQHAGTRSVQTVQRYNGSVHSISGDHPDTSLPLIGGNLYVRDYRFYDKAVRLDEISYVLTNTLWPAQSDPSLVRLFESKRAAYRKQLPRWNPEISSAIVSCLLTILVLSAPAVLARWWRKRQSKPG